MRTFYIFMLFNHHVNLAWLIFFGGGSEVTVLFKFEDLGKAGVRVCGLDW